MDWTREMTETVFIICLALVLMSVIAAIVYYNSTYDPIAARIWECRQMRADNLISACIDRVTSE